MVKPREPLTITEALRRQAGKVEDIARGKRGSDSGLRAAGRADGLREAAAMVASWVGVLPVVERTPETVLRAMLAAYESAALDAETSACARPASLEEDPEWHRLHMACAHMINAVNEVRSALSRLRARQVAPRLSTRLAGDYEARLAGTTPLDAPPAKAGA